MTRILIVDDERSARLTLSRLLENRAFTCETANDVAEAQEALAGEPFELMLLDVNLPGQSGIELVQEIKSEYPDTAVVMATAFDDPELAEVALEHGAYGYIIKPFRASEVLISVANALRRRLLEMENRNHRDNLERMLDERTSELRMTITELAAAKSREQAFSETTIQRLMKAAEFRDSETADHIQRMSHYCALLATKLGWDETRSDRLRIAASMHDVGKLCTPDRILLKPGHLTDQEREVMQVHTEHGYRILSDSGMDLLDLAAEIAQTHHEKFDGSGYTKGLKGEEIPIEGRIAALADVFDALTSARCYKPAFTLERSMKIIGEGRGRHFDPMLVDLLQNNLDDFLAIRAEYPDT